ncbi:hypothetical protein ACFFJY_16590 [Fictibacillus aquaticus]|uniref:hypothetical protein n=1 Tax=Fictibacillus aquaticus TaxID=2021314 RepID=UPI0013FD396C|nr:hypothetical protein [Fictibacillus aquaticus]
MALDEPRKNDVIETEENITIALDPAIAPFLQQAALDVQEFLFMKQLTVVSNVSSC